MREKTLLGKDSIIYDIRILLPVLLIFSYTLFAIIYNNFLKFFFYSIWGINVINILFLILEHVKEKGGYGFHSVKTKGKLIFLFTIFTFISLIVTINLIMYKNHYDEIVNTIYHNNLHNTFVENNANNIENVEEKSIGFKNNKVNTYIGIVQQYLDKTSIGYKTIITITHIGDNNNSFKEINNFDALLFIPNTYFEKNINKTNISFLELNKKESYERKNIKGNNILKSVKNKKNKNDKNYVTKELEKFYSPNSVIIFNAKTKIGNFYEQWVTLNMQNDTKNTIQNHKLKDSNFLWKIGANIRQNILNKIDLKRKYDSLILGMSIGNTNYISDELLKILKDTGTLHLTSVSGSHLCIVTIFLNYLLFWCKPKIRMLLIIMVYVFFILIIGPLIPIMRSIFMGTLGYSAILNNSQKKTIPIFSIVFIVFIVYNPLNVINFSFLLSSFSTLAIILFVKPMVKILSSRIFINKNILNVFLVSLNAQIFTTPILLFFYPNIPIFSVIANTLIMPFASIVTILGILLGFFTLLLPEILQESIVTFLYMCASMLAHIIGGIITFIGKVPFGKIEWGNNFYEISVYVLLFVIPILSISIYKQIKVNT